MYNNTLDISKSLEERLQDPEFATEYNKIYSAVECAKNMTKDQLKKCRSFLLSKRYSARFCDNAADVDIVGIMQENHFEDFKSILIDMSIYSDYKE